MKGKIHDNAFFFWALKTPDGKVLHSTIRETRDLCWEVGFWEVAEREGEMWRQKYWKRWQQSIASAMGKGYRYTRMICHEDK